MAEPTPVREDEFERARAMLDSVELDAVVFDMDGVVTDTATVHAAAWKELFDRWLAERATRTGEAFVPFDADGDYRRFVDGRSRADGVVTFLASRGITLPPGGASDGPRDQTVWGLANRKDVAFRAAVASQGVRAFPSTVRMLDDLRARAVRTAVVSASRNCAEVLAAAGVAGLFEARVDGLDAERLDLPGKPDPAMFLEAARRLGVAPERAAVIEDALAGVEAGRRAGFSLVVGVDRTGHPEALAAAGAHVVVTDLAELIPDPDQSPWVLAYEGYDPSVEGKREALCATGNGYLATRGAGPEASDDGVHYPGTYLAGCYNRLTSQVGERAVEDESLVNAPNWLPLTFRCDGGEWFGIDDVEVLGYHQHLDVRHGVLLRRFRLVDAAGRRTSVVERRLAHLARPHVVALEWSVVPEGWSGRLEVRSCLDGQVVNANVAEYRGLANRHLRPRKAVVDGERLYLEVETTQSQICMATAARTRIWCDGEPVAHGWQEDHDEGRAEHSLAFEVGASQVVRVEKVAAVHTSRDRAIADPETAARTAVERAQGFDELLASHRLGWRQLWDRFGVTLDGPAKDAQLALNVHAFHLLQTLSPHTADLDAGVPARGLHGEAYRGHVFWDELFVFPFLNLRLPPLSRALLRYRWRRLDEARAAARAEGHEGAMFPWQSGSDGREETPHQLFNLRSGRWLADNSRLQRHVGLAVAYNVWQYWQVTADHDFLVASGAELIVEVARYFASLATWDPATGRHHIVGVMGPDEFHDGYPGAAAPGLCDNAYTNVMAAWVLSRALDTVRLLAGHHSGDVLERIGLRDTELDRWEEVSRTLAVPFASDGRISQFEGYEDLAELDWDRYRAAYGNIGRLDLILAAEGDTPNRYKASKQADVLMLFYLLSSDELTALLSRLGYHFDPATIPASIDYYLARSTNGSTLSRVVHAWVLSRSDRHRSWSLFHEALHADLADTQGGTTREGIHLGAMAATLDIVQRCWTGLEVVDGVLWLAPRLPAEVDRLRLDLAYRGQRIAVDATHHELGLALRPSLDAPVRVGVGGSVVELGGGDTHRVALAPAPSSWAGDGGEGRPASRTGRSQVPGYG